MNGSGAFGNYTRAQSLGAVMQIVLSDGWTDYKAPWPGDDGNWLPWENDITNTVVRATLDNKAFQYDIWNEPDIGYFWSPGGAVRLGASPPTLTPRQSSSRTLSAKSFARRWAAASSHAASCSRSAGSSRRWSSSSC